MDENTSLEDFADSGGDQGVEGDERAERDESGDGEATSSDDADPVAVERDDAEDGDGDTKATDASNEAEGPSATDPAVATYDWTPGGADCAACDETVERRWRDDPGFVCEACKDW